jgi:hypothetical protein
MSQLVQVVDEVPESPIQWGQEKMSFKQIFLAVGISLLCVLCIDLLFLHYLFPMKRAALIERANQKVQQSLLEHPPVSDSDILSPSTGPVTATDFKTAAIKCLGQGPWDEFKKLPEQLEKTFGVQNKTVDIENFDLLTADGQIRRIHVSGDRENNQQVRFHSTLPKTGEQSPIPLPEEVRKLKPREQIEELKKGSTVTLHQVKQRWLLGNGASFLFTTENGELKDLQIFGSARTLTCLPNSCQCL